MYEEIQAVYKVFATYRKPRDFPACEHCLSATEKKDSLKRKLHELSADELSIYAADAFFTLGDVPDFKYFLPRILELTVNGIWWLDPETVLAKLRLAEWDNWPANEKAVVLALLNRKFATLLKNPDTKGQDIDTWICALARCLDDITPYLDLLLAEASEDKLLSFIEWNQPALTRGKLSNPFWEPSLNEQRLREWFKSAPVKQLLTDKYGVIF